MNGGSRAPESASPRRIAGAVLFLGAALRLWQYFGNSSLWIDEIALAENVLRSPMADLIGSSLAFDQVAAPGFLAAVKIATELLGPSELALRFFPLVCSLASLVLFARLARRVLAGWTAVFAVTLFAFLPSMIAYGSEVKQYSTDVAVSLALTLIAFGLRDGLETGTRFVGAALIGVLAPWCSQPAIFTIAGLTAGLAWFSLRDRRRGFPARLAGILALWAVSATAAAVHARHIMAPSTREYMGRFWRPSSPSPIYFALILLGVAVLWRRSETSAVLVFGPVLVTLAAAAAHVYPFSGRAILFLTPVFLLAIAECAAWIVAALARLRVPRPVGAAVLTLPLLGALALDMPVYRHEEMRPVLRELAARLAPGDAIYVYYGAERAFRFYAPRVGIAPDRATLGACHRGDPRAYLRELDGFRGRARVWVVFAHALPRLAEEPAIRGYLQRIGRRIQVFAAEGASAELYDLSDPGRLAAVVADVYPVAAVDPAMVAAIGCGNGPLAAAPWPED